MERRRLKGRGFHTEPSLEIAQTWGGKAERGGGAEAFHQWVEMIEVVVSKNGQEVRQFQSHPSDYEYLNLRGQRDLVCVTKLTNKLTLTVFQEAPRNHMSP